MFKYDTDSCLGVDNGDVANPKTRCTIHSSHTDVCSPGNPTHDDVRAWVRDGAATPFEVTVQADKVYPDISLFNTKMRIL